MINLKKFESFSSDSNGLVTYISYDKFDNLLSSEEIDEVFDSELDRIKYLIDLKYPSLIKKYEKINRFRFDKVKSVCSFDISFKGGDGYIQFYKFEDGWWMVEMSKKSMSKPRLIKTWMLDDFDGIKTWIDTEFLIFIH